MRVYGTSTSVSGASVRSIAAVNTGASFAHCRLSELESLRLGAGKRLEEYKKEHASLLAKEREGEKLKEEVERLKGEVRAPILLDKNSSFPLTPPSPPPL